jgi:mRNA interferase MazF
MLQSLAGMVAGMVERGEIYSAALLEPAGTGATADRPVLIVQNDIGNEFSRQVIVACITSSLSTRAYPVNVAVPEKILPKASVVRLNQILTIDRSQLGEKLGHLPGETMAEVDEALGVSLGLPRRD